MCGHVQGLVDDGVSRYVADGAMTRQARRIQVFDVLNTDQRRDVRRVGAPRPLALKNSRVPGRDFPNVLILGE